MSQRSEARVIGVSLSAKHGVQKAAAAAIVLRAGLGVAGDVHAGALIRHRYDRRRDPGRANNRQVHLIGAELYDELSAVGYDLMPGQLGENITTRGIDLTVLPEAAHLRIGRDAIVELTIMRDPCVLLDRLRPGLCAATTMMRDGSAVLRHGMMGIVVCPGEVRPGDAIHLERR